MIRTTSIPLSTTPTAIITTATTWANTRDAGASDPVPLQVFNVSTAADVHVTGSSASTVGMIIPPRTAQQFSLWATEQVWGVTTAGSTGTVIVMAGRQQ